MKTGNVLLEKSFAFGLRMFGLNELLISKRLYAAADQIFRSGTSIGANAEEAVGGASRRDGWCNSNFQLEAVPRRLGHSLRSTILQLKVGVTAPANAPLP